MFLPPTFLLPIAEFVLVLKKKGGRGCGCVHLYITLNVSPIPLRGLGWLGLYVFPLLRNGIVTRSGEGWRREQKCVFGGSWCRQSVMCVRLGEGLSR